MTSKLATKTDNTFSPFQISTYTISICNHYIDIDIDKNTHTFCQKYSDFTSCRIGSTPPMNSYFRSKEGLPNPLLPLAAVPKIQHLRLRALQVLHPSRPWARTPPPMLSTYKQRVRSLLLWGSRDLVILCRILTSETNRLKINVPILIILTKLSLENRWEC